MIQQSNPTSMDVQRAPLLDYYAHPGIVTDPGEYAGLLDNLPVDIEDLCRIAQNNLIHVFMAELYGVQIAEEQKAALQVRRVARKLLLIQDTDGRPLTAARPAGKRQVGNCRDFTTLLVAMLRCQGVPARARCGFATYFTPGRYEDHWVCEVWNSSEGRWILVDAQLDEVQRKFLGYTFSPLDVPRDQFIVAGHAWQLCRAGQADPDCFGIMDMSGWWFIWGNVMRDFLALNKVEILPWDWWESVYWSHRLGDLLPPEPDLAPYDRIAALSQAGDEAFTEIRSLYENDPGLHIPKGW